MKKWKLIVLLLLLTPYISGCTYVDAFRSSDSDNGHRSIERLVKAELLRSEDIEAAPIRVKVVDYVIVLEGVVEQASEKESAEEVAAKMYPRYQVRNDIEVR